MELSRLQREEMPEEEMALSRLQREEMPEEEVALKRLQREDMPEEEMALSRLQREEMPEEEVALKRLQREDMPEEEMALKRLQRDSTGYDFYQGGDVSNDIEGEIEGARGSGQAMDDNTRGNMESAFGADFSNVRVHTDKQSGNLNNAVQAKAFTTGQDIFFNQGQYNPGSSSGQELLAHELTHVVQQNGASVQKKEED
jgi:hypothetical protein